MGKEEFCPFCRYQLPHHNRNCHYQSIPSAADTKKKEDKKEQIKTNKKKLHKII